MIDLQHECPFRKSNLAGAPSSIIIGDISETRHIGSGRASACIVDFLILCIPCVQVGDGGRYLLREDQKNVASSLLLQAICFITLPQSLSVLHRPTSQLDIACDKERPHFAPDPSVPTHH